MKNSTRRKFIQQSFDSFVHGTIQDPVKILAAHLVTARCLCNRHVQYFGGILSSDISKIPQLQTPQNIDVLLVNNLLNFFLGNTLREFIVVHTAMLTPDIDNRKGYV